MTREYRISRRNFLVAAAATTAQAVTGNVAWAKRRELKPLSDDMLKKIEEALPQKATAKPAKSRKILIFWLCEGFFHGSIPVGNAAIKMMGQKTGAYDSVVSDDMAMFAPDKLAEFDAVVFNNTTRLKFDKEEQRKALMDFVNGGKGIVGIHAATDNFYNWPEAAEMMGGLFAGHPWGGGGTWAVKIDEPEHTLNKGFGGKGFWIKEEIYKMKDPYSRENLRVLVSLDMSKKENRKGREDGDNAISWLREKGKGRVFYTSFGHNNHIFTTPAILQHMLDGIQYALGDLKADATPSAKLAKKPEPALAPEKK